MVYTSSVLGQAGGPAAARKTPEERLKGACQDFEALFLQQMLKQMRKSIPKSGLLDGGMAEDIYQDMLYSSVAEQASRAEGFGIAKALYNHFLPALEAHSSRKVDGFRGSEGGHG